MNRFVFVFVCIAACSPSKSGTAGPQGATGAPGAVGAQGAKGDAGAAGVCDTSSCPSVTSINGLSGGTVSGAVSLNGPVTLSSVTGVVVAAGSLQNSVSGFYCGTSKSVTGEFSGAGSPYDDTEPYNVMPKRRAKKLCVDTCNGNAAAHPCLTSEIQNAQMLNGGGDAVVLGNGAVPMPPDGKGWVLSTNPMDSCADLTTSSGNGVAYSKTADEGSFSATSCGTSLGLYCCL